MVATAKLALRYPVGTDKVSDGALAIQHLAEDVDARFVAAASKSGTDAGTTTSTSYVTALTGSADAANGYSVVVPPSGRLLLGHSALMRLSAGPTGSGRIGIRLSGAGLTAGGTADLADQFTLYLNNAPSTGYSLNLATTFLLGPFGLTPGGLLTVQQVYKVGVGTTTLTVDNRSLWAVPLPY